MLGPALVYQPPSASQPLRHTPDRYTRPHVGRVTGRTQATAESLVGRHIIDAGMLSRCSSLRLSEAPPEPLSNSRHVATSTARPLGAADHTPAEARPRGKDARV